MKHIIRILAAALLCAPMAYASTGTATWTNPSQTVCPATSPKSCVNAATFTDITSLTPVVLSAAISPTATTYSFPGPTDGQIHTYSLVYTGFNATGAAITSSAATTTAQAPFTLAPPTGLSVTIQ